MEKTKKIGAAIGRGLLTTLLGLIAAYWYAMIAVFGTCALLVCLLILALPDDTDRIL